MQPMIQVSHLSKFYCQGKNERITALRDVNFTIDKGEIFGIMGMSGAGKSTLIRTLNYLDPPSLGEVFINGIRLSSLSEKELRAKRQKIAMIFQQFNLLMQKTVLENICFPMEIAGKSKKEAVNRALSLLKKVGLSDKANAYPSKLSGGQQQRAAIARAIANEPEILLCDEATSALDPENTHIILQLLKDINRETGITIVLITHQFQVIQAICHRAAVIEDGNMVPLQENQVKREAVS
ncbi:MAG: ATP-binding cassette domain-containing protein [Lachnospiraceae bacterium]